MNLAIVHYHLNRGGVTQVIANQVRSLDSVANPAEPWNIAIVSGGRREQWREDFDAQCAAVRLSLVDVPGLDYDTLPSSSARPATADLAEGLLAALKHLDFSPGDTVIQIHNHSLGKNRDLPGAVCRLAEAGYATLLQIHDFAEDFRPVNYQRIDPATPLYPQASHIHYAVINGRDLDILRDAGMDPARLHLLPNPIPKIEVPASRPQARARLRQWFDVAAEDGYTLYPVRCIRRKNVGEALLYSALAPPGAIVGLTLPPLNPAEAPLYARWRLLAGELALPCRFEVGVPGALSFAENLAAADQILTTSVAEGFGMVFLESWLAGRPLVGRDLPEVTTDFVQAGVRFDWLRPQLRVPLDWMGADTFRRTVTAAYHRTLAAYRRSASPDLQGALDARLQDGLVDFGDLDEPMQEQVLCAVCGSDRKRQRVLECNPGLNCTLGIRTEQAMDQITANGEVVEREFSPAASGRRLADVLRRVVDSPRDGLLEPLPHRDRILDRFLDFARFRLLRT